MTDEIPTTAVRRRGIMTIRTLDDSLHNDTKHKEVARVRRQLRVFNISQSCHGRIEKNTSVSMSDLSKVEDNLSVSFRSISIREYPMIVGDNPSVSSGPPLTIAWDFDELGTILLEEYENHRPTRRSADQMTIPKMERLKILESSGISRSEIEKVVKDVNIARSQRLQTRNNLSNDKGTDEKKGLLNILGRGKKKTNDDEDKYIQYNLELAERQRATASIEAENEAALLYAMIGNKFGGHGSAGAETDDEDNYGGGEPQDPKPITASED